MKRGLKIAGLVLGVLLLVVLGFAAYVQITGIPTYDISEIPEFKVDVDSNRLVRGERLTRMVCASCHDQKQEGALIGGKMVDVDDAFGEIWISNLTHPQTGLSSYTDSELAFLLRTGLKKDGSYIPPWMPKFPNMADEDMKDLIAFLRSDHPMLAPRDIEHPPTQPSFLSKLLTHTVMKPFPYPEEPIRLPDADNVVAMGEYLANDIHQCYTCHSSDFTTNDDYEPTNSKGFYGGGTEMLDAAGQKIFSANLTMDKETGLGNWTEADFIKAVKQGVRPDHHPVYYPMPKFTLMTDEEVAAIWAYLQTVPIIQNEVQRSRAEVN